MVPGGTMETTDESEIQEELYAEFPPNLTYNDVASNDWLFWLKIPKFFSNQCHEFSSTNVVN